MTHISRRGLFQIGVSLAAGTALGEYPLNAQAATTPSELLNIKDFGARGDGTNDDSEALIRFRDYLQLNRSVSYRVLFPSGQYIYTNNRWLLGVDTLTIYAEGAQFQNRSSSGANRRDRVFNNLSIFETYGDTDWPGDLSFETGRRIRTAEVAATRISLMNASDASMFSAGQRVLLHGFDQQWGGFPINLRFYEWNRIRSVDLAAGTISLETPIQYRYDESWRETVDNSGPGKSWGAPRVLALERTNYYYPRYIEIVGATFLRNPRSSQDDGLMLSAENLILRRCRYSGSANCSENKYTLFDNCQFVSAEPDKLCGRFELTNSTVSGDIAGATGCQEAIFSDNIFTGCNFHVSPGRVSYMRNRFVVRAGQTAPVVATNYSHWSTERLTFQDNTIVHDGNISAAVDSGQAIVFAAVKVSPDGGLLLDDSNDTREGVIQQLRIGTVVQRTNAANSGRVNKISYQDGFWLLQGTWLTSVAPGEEWFFYQIGEIVESGTQWMGGARRAINEPRPRQMSGVASTGRATVVLGGPFPWAATGETHDVYGYMTALRTTVSRGYTGSTPSPSLTVILDVLGVGQVGIVNGMSLADAGYSEARDGYKIGSATSTFLDPKWFVRKITLYYSNAGQSLLGSDDQMPLLTVEYDVSTVTSPA